MPTTHERVKAFIAALRQSHPQMEAVFTEGACLHFYQILRCAFPEARGWYKTSHVITQISGRFYDITGTIRPGPGEYKPFTDLNPRRVASTWKHLPHCTPDLMPKPILDTDTMAAIRRGLNLQERFPVDSRVRYDGEAEGVGTVTGHEPERVYVRYDGSEHGEPVATDPDDLVLISKD